MSLDPYAVAGMRLKMYDDLAACVTKFRQDLRQLLHEHGVASNPGWTEDDIVLAFRKLLDRIQAGEERHHE